MHWLKLRLEYHAALSQNEKVARPFGGSYVGNKDEVQVVQQPSCDSLRATAARESRAQRRWHYDAHDTTRHAVRMAGVAYAVMEVSGDGVKNEVCHRVGVEIAP